MELALTGLADAWAAEGRGFCVRREDGPTHSVSNVCWADSIVVSAKSLAEPASMTGQATAASERFRLRWKAKSFEHYRSLAPTRRWFPKASPSELISSPWRVYRA